MLQWLAAVRVRIILSQRLYGSLQEGEAGDGTTERQGPQWLVFLASHADKPVSRYIVDVTDATQIFLHAGRRLRATDLATLEHKHWVQVWFAGPLTRTFPQKDTAAQMVILSFQSK